VARILLLLGLAVGLFIIFRWLFRQPPRVYWQWIAVLLAAGLLILVLTGRAHWLTAVFAALLPFVRGLLTLLGHIPLLKRVLAGVDASKSRSEPSSGQTSTVQSKYIRMTLNHDSGDINGEVLEGQFKGSTLDRLKLEALLQLLGECQDDEESVDLPGPGVCRHLATTGRRAGAATGSQRTGRDVARRGAADTGIVIRRWRGGDYRDSPAADAEVASGSRRFRLSRGHDKSGEGYVIGQVEILSV